MFLYMFIHIYQARGHRERDREWKREKARERVKVRERVRGEKRARVKREKEKLGDRDRQRERETVTKRYFAQAQGSCNGYGSFFSCIYVSFTNLVTGSYLIYIIHTYTSKRARVSMQARESAHLSERGSERT